MINFANPQYFYLLLLIPLLFVMFILSRRARSKNLKRYGQKQVLLGLMPDVSKYKPWIILTIQCLVILAVVVVLARPRAGSKKETSKMQGIEAMVVLDVSNSMLASSSDDPNGVSRMQRAKMVVEKLIDKMQDDKVGFIVFAGNAYMQMPITSDYHSAKMLLSGVNPGMLSNQGTAIGAAIDLAVNSFSPDEKVGKSIIVITDGENHEDDAKSSAEAAAKRGIQVNVIGMGTTKGAPIPLGNGQYLRDDQNQVVVSHLDEASAQSLAAVAKGVYVNGNAGNAVEVVSENMRKLGETELQHVVFSKQDEKFPVFAWIALALLVLSVFVSEVKNPWLRKYNFFTKEEIKNDEK